MTAPERGSAGGRDRHVRVHHHDGDGDPSTVTLTITLTDCGLAASNDDMTVNEAGVGDGQRPSSDGGTVTGRWSDNVTPGIAPYTYALVGTRDRHHGTLTFNANGTYSYTLDIRYDTSPTANNSITTENNVETFTYQVTDANGNTTTSTITIDIIDDVPRPIAPVPLVGSNKAGTSATAFLDSDDNIDNNVGADQPGTVRFPTSLNSTPATDFRRRADHLYGLYRRPCTDRYGRRKQRLHHHAQSGRKPCRRE